MKKLLLLLLVFPLLFASCSSDDDTDGNNPIVGTWTLTHVDAGLGYVEVPNDSDNSTITFNSNGTFTNNGVIKGIPAGGYKVTDNTIKLNLLGNEFLSMPIINLEESTLEFSVAIASITTKMKLKKK